MPRLHVCDRAPCPARHAPRYLQRFFAEHAEGEAAVLAVRPALSLTGLPEMLLARDCIVHLEHLEPSGPLVAELSVTWEPAGGGTSPRFAGRLAIQREEGGESCCLRLEGDYEPHTVPALLEGAVSRVIAESTGRDVVACLTKYLAQAYRGTQTARRNRQAADEAR